MSTENIETENLQEKLETKKAVKKAVKKPTKKTKKSNKKSTKKKTASSKSASNKTKTKKVKKKVESKKTKSKKIEQQMIKPAKPMEPKVSQGQRALSMSEDFLSKQISDNKVVTEKVWKWGGLALLVLSIYLSAMVSSVENVFFDTEGIATVVANEIDISLPGHLAAFESDLISTAPENTKSMVSNIAKILPELNSVAKEKINSVVDIMPVFKTELNDAIKAYFAENQEEMKSFVETHSEQEFANYFMDDLLATVSLSIDDKLKSEGGMETVKSLSLSRLVKLNSHLGYLAEKNRYELTEKEKLQRRTIVSWAKLLGNL